MKKLFVAAILLLALLPIVSAIDVSTCSELQAINNDKTASYDLINDIDCSGVSFTPIGNSNWNNEFKGTIDGHGYVVSNMNINLPSISYVGFIGYLHSTGTIQNIGLENITVTGSARVGSIAGHSEGTISNSYATGSVTTSSWNQIGGFIGSTTSTSNIENCYAQVSVSGNDNIGGFIGEKAGTVTNSYAAGEMTTAGWPSYAGGFFGSATGTDSGNYWDTTISGQTTSAGSATGKTSGEMKQEATFVGWDFTDTWSIEEGIIYPYLQTFGDVVVSNETSNYDAHLNYYVQHMPDGTYKIVVGEGVTYLEGDTYIPVILDFKPLDYSSTYYPNYQYGMESMKYKAVFKDTATAGQLVTFDSNDLKVIYQPQFIGWINDWDGRENIASPQDSGFLNLNDSFVYPNAYGEGIDLVYEANANYLKEKVIIENRSLLTEPSPTMISGGNVKLYVNFILDFENEGDVLINNNPWNRSGIIHTQEDIIVENTNGSVAYMIKKPYVIDAEGTTYPATYRVENANDVYFLMIQIPYETVWNATYPITIDPTTGYNDTILPNVTLDLSNDIFNPLDKIVLYNVTGDGTVDIDTNLSQRDYDEAENKIVYSYAMDPSQLQFDYGETYVKNSTGELLLKCVDWNMTTETCGSCAEYENDTCVDWNESWVYVGDLTVGSPYNFTFDNVDPAYAEYSRSATESTTTSTTFVNKVTKTFTPAIPGDYLVMGTGALTGSSTSDSVEVRMTFDGTTVADHIHEPKDASKLNDYQSFSAFSIETLDTNPHTLNMDYRTTNAAIVAYIKEANLAYLYLPDYEYTEQQAEQSLTDTSATYATLTFTPPTTGDYLILASGEYANLGSTSRTSYVNLYQASTIIDGVNKESKDVTDYRSFGFMKKITLIGGVSQTFTVRGYEENAGADGRIRNIHIVAIPVAAEVDLQYGETNALSSTASTSPVTKTTVSFTPTYPGDYLIMASAEIGGDSLSYSTKGSLYVDGVEYCSNVMEPKETTDRDYISVNCLLPYNFTNTTHTITLRHNAVGSGNSFIRNARIAAMAITNTPPDCNPILNANWIISDEQICDGVERTTGTGNIQITTGGSLILINNANITTSAMPTIQRWSNPYHILIERGSKLIIN
jgi:hypothetical protein